MSYFYCYYFNCTINRQSHAFSYNFGTIVHVTFKIALGYASCNYATVTGAIIPKLYSNACNYTRTLTLALPWVKAGTGSSMAVGHTFTLLMRIKKGKGLLRETRRVPATINCLYT